MIVYVGNPKESLKKLLELKNEFSSISEFKFNIQKPIISPPCYYGRQNNDSPPKDVHTLILGTCEYVTKATLQRWWKIILDYPVGPL